MRRLLTVCALVVAPATLTAQGVPEPQHPALGTGRLTIEALLGRGWMTENFNQNRFGSTEFGGRLAWRLGAPVSDPEDGSWTNLTSVGLFLKQSPTEPGRGGRYRVAHYGVLVDHLPFGVISGRFEPIISAEAGTFSLETKETRGSSGIFYQTDEMRRYVSVAPGIGARISMLDRYGVRLDARDVILYRNDNFWHVPEISAGVSVRW